MTVFTKLIAALGAVVLLAAPAFAGSISPVGQWQISTGEARYSVTACGKGGTQLCAKLVWLAPDKRNEDSLAMLNSYVVRGAVPVDENRWTGSVVFDGKSYEGTMTLVSSDTMKLKGCSGMLCQTMEFIRI